MEHQIKFQSLISFQQSYEVPETPKCSSKYLQDMQNADTVSERIMLQDKEQNRKNTS